MHNHLFNLLSQKVVINDHDVELCEKCFEPVFVPKNRIIESEGEVPRYLYFVVSGFLRLFFYNDAGDQVTTHINCPPGFITSYTSFINQTRSVENVECVTDCELLRITKNNLDFLIKNSPAIKDFSIWVFQLSINYNENRSKELATLTAEQRYRKLIDTYPQIIHNVPLQYIASFLGMNSKSLSRIRKQMIK